MMTYKEQRELSKAQLRASDPAYVDRMRCNCNDGVPENWVAKYRCGLHSGFPKCCLRNFVRSVMPFLMGSPSRAEIKKRLEPQGTLEAKLGLRAQYHMCPECIASEATPVTPKRCPHTSYCWTCWR